MIDLALISGSGFYDFPGLEEGKDLKIKTSYGVASVRTGIISRKKIAFIARHGENHSLLSNMINYRANAIALKELETSTILSTTVCGVLNPSLPLAKPVVFADLFFPENRLPTGELCTIYDKKGASQRGHFIFEKPFSGSLIKQLENSSQDPLIGFTYAHVNGPRFNSKPEIQMLRNYASFVSQTAGPEIVLAGELEIPVALIGFGVDYANGVSKVPTPPHILAENLKKSKSVFISMIKEMLGNFVEPKFDGFLYRFE
ncbi:MTAP family purine nucleoside phosphorylase [Acidobacteriota bacterium]